MGICVNFSSTGKIVSISHQLYQLTIDYNDLSLYIACYVTIIICYIQILHAVFKLHHTMIYYMLHNMLYNRLNIFVLDAIILYYIFLYTI